MYMSVLTVIVMVVVVPGPLELDVNAIVRNMIKRMYHLNPSAVQYKWLIRS
jgi:hypothetical protein